MTFVRTGTMAIVSASLLPRQSTSSSTSARLAATRGAESERGTLLADVVRVGRA